MIMVAFRDPPERHLFVVNRRLHLLRSPFRQLPGNGRPERRNRAYQRTGIVQTDDNSLTNPPPTWP